MAHIDPEQGGPEATDWRSVSATNARPPLNGQSRPDGVHGGPVRDATLQELIGRLVNDVSELVDRQVELAKQEVREDIGEGLGAAKTLALGAGIAAGAGLLLVVTAWMALVWFLNWLGDRIWSPWLDSLGWIVGFLVLGAALLFAYQRFIKGAIRQFKDLSKRPLERTRETLKEDLEWLKSLRTPSAR